MFNAIFLINESPIGVRLRFKGNVINLINCIQKMFVGNGLDRSGIVAVTTILNKNVIE